MEALVESLMIDSDENWCVAIFDVLKAYIWDDIPKDKTVLVNSEGKLVDIICDVDPSLIEYFRYEHDKKLLLSLQFFGTIISQRCFKIGFQDQPLRQICSTQNGL